MAVVLGSDFDASAALVVAGPCGVLHRAFGCVHGHGLLRLGIEDLVREGLEGGRGATSGRSEARVGGLVGVERGCWSSEDERGRSHYDEGLEGGLGVVVAGLLLSH